MPVLTMTKLVIYHVRTHLSQMTKKLTTNLKLTKGLMKKMTKKMTKKIIVHHYVHWGPARLQNGTRSAIFSASSETLSGTFLKTGSCVAKVGFGGLHFEAEMSQIVGRALHIS
jgi:hypothetical protein